MPTQNTARRDWHPVGCWPHRPEAGEAPANCPLCTDGHADDVLPAVNGHGQYVCRNCGRSASEETVSTDARFVRVAEALATTSVQMGKIFSGGRLTLTEKFS